MKAILSVIMVIGWCSIACCQQIDQPASIVEFSLSNMGFNTVEGTMQQFDGTIDFDVDNLELCQFDVCVDVATLNTANTKRDEHLLKEDFFDAANHPSVCFFSNQITTSARGYLATGTLSIKGVESIVNIPFTYSDNTFVGDLNIDRTTFDLGPKGGFMVGKAVAIVIRVELD